jgi:D-alanyl-D-alanine carboxypeptidase/D-alanyl-D-alanine-endopeptidase (penicillin-binding protein 4)
MTCRSAHLGLTLALALSVAPACATHQAAAQSQGRPANTRAVRQLQSELAQVFRAPIMARGAWGVEVRSLDSGERLYSLDAGKLMMPASNMKIVTLAGAAETLGWDYRFTTTLSTKADVADGHLLGDLIVRSDGDPTINTRNKRSDAALDEWAAALRAAGITSVEGRVIGDDQAFDDEGLGAGWAWDYLQAGYAAPVGALQFNENTATLTITPSPLPGDPAIVTLTPGAGYDIVNRAVTGAASIAPCSRSPGPFRRAPPRSTGRSPS